MAKLIDGLLVSQHIKNMIKNEVSALASKGIKPCLATVLVGDNQASATYIKNKQIAASSVGILTRDFKLPKKHNSRRTLQDN